MKTRIFWAIVVSVNLFVMGIFTYQVIFKAESNLLIKLIAGAGFIASLNLFLEKRNQKQ